MLTIYWIVISMLTCLSCTLLCSTMVWLIRYSGRLIDCLYVLLTGMITV
uniref:Uncharacterized protein n=1 Tax=Timema douglasi TaxID=61478 RepID=A0A7R8W1C2_TIMDO|nr:unnamed protein product [Timema douglasi]